MRSALLLITGLCCAFAPGTAPAGETIDYVKQIKPILSARCYACHGALTQKGKLRTDSVKSLIAGSAGGAVIEPGKSDESRLVDLISEEGEGRMPPPGDGEALSADQITLIKTWIDQGAVAPPGDAPEPDPRDHWAFRPPVRPSVPSTDAARPGNPIDAFLAAGWKAKGLTPQSSAPKSLLQRRVYLDLVGVPPTAEEQAAFLNDDSPAAYEAMVDRLLSSKHYSERWGRHWMDVWRYSDWWGLGAEVRNSQKHIWHWRDWIIESLNADKGYDQMVREMIAADEMHPDDPDRLRATGFLARGYFKFNRNTWLEEVVEHTSKAFLGLTFNCAKCHDHKFDPISHNEYYQFRAFFEPYQVRTDQVPGQLDFEKEGIPRVFDSNLDAPTYRFERGNEARPLKNQPLKPGVPSLLAWADLAIKPVTLPLEASRPGLRPFVLEDHLKAANTRLETAQKSLAKAREHLAAVEADKTSAPAGEAASAARSSFRDDFSVARPGDWESTGGRWVYENGKLLQNDPGEIRSVHRTKANHPVDFRASLRFTITGGEPWRSVGLSFDSAEGREVLVYLSAHAGGPKLQISYQKGGASSYPAEGSQARPIKVGEPYELAVSVRGTLVNVAVNGEHALAYRLPVERAPGAISLVTYAAKAEFTSMELVPLAPGAQLVEVGSPTYKGAKPIDRAKAQVTVAEKALATALSQPKALQARVAADRARYQQPPAENAKSLAIAAALAERQEALAKAEEALARLELQVDAKAKDAKDDQKQHEAATTALAAARKAVDEKSEAYTPLRGALKAVESPTDTDGPNVLTFPATSTGRRTALANWLTDRKNPLTARVAVNHIWARHFGKPLVTTVFDFGRKGAQPTHPELLDWLAVDFMENGWSMKRLHKLMVLSDAYRRSSSSAGAAPATIAADPENHLYWRMNPVRMEAQVVRDSLFHMAGELSDQSGGPSVPQSEAMSPRRSVYFVHSHNDHNKFLSTFDDASVLDCYRRDESVVPVQALALWNSSLSQTMAAKIADRLNKRLGETSDAKFAVEAFQTILCATPTADERSACEQALTDLKTLLEKRGATEPSRRAREILVQSLLNHNDFITIR
ncbi:MAG: PSD1 and planctomycete cytochrome C domain-containing protein [Paludisphaera borealis]|uniref:PSD1 and planctomycete cytochrome C domain-containing protein n=1 Tax=Paludisphaera borealis TaxID=1387353 RepID=UPI00284C2701|nr:PSD1 and planctomycete cytochrome C domain-containing protein [Paludisphaera borealis]MDR3621719.1 PSD1 and planctomycete cytochrome C domain-containing protein [Paludisphaera borealis]